MATATAADLMFLLSQAGHALQTEMTARLAEVGLTPREQCVLSKAMTGEHSQIRLAEMSALDKTTMVVTVDKLEQAGLAERRPSASDRRARIIAVTPAGERLVEQGQEIIARTYEDVLGALPEDERDVFVNGLARLVGGPLAHPQECEHPPRRRRT
jgi:MarR family transcriptional regulator for hemolysin